MWIVGESAGGYGFRRPNSEISCTARVAAVTASASAPMRFQKKRSYLVRDTGGLETFEAPNKIQPVEHCSIIIETSRKAVAWMVSRTLMAAWRHPDGNLNVPCLNWNGDRWHLNWNWLENRWNSNYRLLRLRISFRLSRVHRESFCNEEFLWPGARL